MELYKLIYKNHINEVVEFGVNGLWFTNTELHDYEWKYTSNNGKISNFDRGIVEKKLSIVIACRSKEQGINYMNKIVECADKDILNGTEGTLYFGDYYLKCYLTKSHKGTFIERKGYLEAEITIASDQPQWVREVNNTFADLSSSGKNLDFAFDFPYDFTSPTAINTLVNPSFTNTDFRIRIYGEVTNPTLYIGGYMYSVNCYVASGEYLTIDSKNKTITITRNNGEIVNHFKDRNKTNYIFEKIPSGELAVTWEGTFTFDVTLYEERSEPKWI